MTGAIAITAWRRPAYLRRVLQAIRQCDGVENYVIFIGINPDPDTVAELRSISEGIDFAEHVVFVRERNLGCNLNIKLVLDSAFERFDYVIHFQDDSLVTSDALCYFEWAHQFGTDLQNFTVGCYRHDKGWLPRDGPKPEGEDGRVGRQPYFTCWCWATWRDRWQKITDRWPESSPLPKEDRGTWWDLQMCDVFRQDRLEVMPHVSRVWHIGIEKGMHMQDANRIFLPYWAGSGGFVRPSGFVLA